MRFWDSSAIVPLCFTQPASPAATDWLKEDPVMVVWWGTPVECRSAFARLEREGPLTGVLLQSAFRRLHTLQESWVEVHPTDLLRSHANRLLRIHSLRAADAMQLAAALVWAGIPPEGRSFLTFDFRLAAAARLEGFEVPGLPH